MSSAGKEPCVFVVDDDEAVRGSLQLTLTLRHFQVETFASADEFLSRYQPCRSGCLVLDISLPGMSGLELQRLMNNHTWLLPIIFMTGSALVPQSVDALKAGAVDFLEKPFTPRTLVRRIQEAFVQDQRHRAELARHKVNFASLDACEKEMLQALLQTQTYQGKNPLACRLGIQPETAESRLQDILDKTQISLVSELLSVASMINSIE